MLCFQRKLKQYFFAMTRYSLLYRLGTNIEIMYWNIICKSTSNTQFFSQLCKSYMLYILICNSSDCVTIIQVAKANSAGCTIDTEFVLQPVKGTAVICGRPCSNMYKRKIIFVIVEMFHLLWGRFTIAQHYMHKQRVLLKSKRTVCLLEFCRWRRYCNLQNSSRHNVYKRGSLKI